MNGNDRDVVQVESSQLFNKIPTLQAELDRHCCLQSSMVVAWAALKVLKSSNLKKIALDSADTF